MPEATTPLPLRDIIAPLEQGWWPPAPGWWVLTAVFLLLLVWAIRLLVKYFRYEYAVLRTAALHELTELQAQAKLSDSEFTEQLSALLKRVAVVRYARLRPAKLSGEAWLSFLDQTGPDRFSEAGGEALLEAQYRPSSGIKRSPLLGAARTWIKAI